MKFRLGRKNHHHHHHHQIALIMEITIEIASFVHNMLRTEFFVRFRGVRLNLSDTKPYN